LLQFAVSLGALLGLALAPTLARADACGEFTNIASHLYGFWGDRFESFFPIGDEDICGPLTGKFQASCEKSVHDAVKCWDKRVDEIASAAKYPCKTEGAGASDCKRDYKQSANSDHAEIEQLAENAIAACEDAADGFFDFCMFP
jgi:hypothetical protein